MVGDPIDVEGYHIIFNDYKFKSTSSAVRCLELLFKLFHSLNLEYPAESKHIWHFIQEMVFQMPASSKNSSTACVMADINFHLKNISYKTNV